jgi:hypothetical protein
MKVRFNFNLEAWIKGLEVEADSYDEALDKLYRMTFSEIAEAGYAKESDITDIDGDIVERILNVQVYDIEYDIEEDDYDTPEEYNKIINSLPSELTLTVTVEEGQDEEEVIADEITYQTDWLVKNFNYFEIETK